MYAGMSWAPGFLNSSGSSSDRSLNQWGAQCLAPELCASSWDPLPTWTHPPSSAREMKQSVFFFLGRDYLNGRFPHFCAHTQSMLHQPDLPVSTESLSEMPHNSIFSGKMLCWTNEKRGVKRCRSHWVLKSQDKIRNIVQNPTICFSSQPSNIG